MRRLDERPGGETGARCGWQPTRAGISPAISSSTAARSKRWSIPARRWWPSISRWPAHRHQADASSTSNSSDTANGTARAASAMIDHLRSDGSHRQVQAIVLDDKAARRPLIGMSFLKRLDKFRWPTATDDNAVISRAIGDHRPGATGFRSSM